MYKPVFSDLYTACKLCSWRKMLLHSYTCSVSFIRIDVENNGDHWLVDENNGEQWFVFGNNGYHWLVVKNSGDPWLVVANNGDQYLVVMNNGGQWLVVAKNGTSVTSCCEQ